MSIDTCTTHNMRRPDISRLRWKNTAPPTEWSCQEKSSLNASKPFSSNTCVHRGVPAASYPTAILHRTNKSTPLGNKLQGKKSIWEQKSRGFIITIRRLYLDADPSKLFMRKAFKTFMRQLKCKLGLSYLMTLRNCCYI